MENNLQSLNNNEIYFSYEAKNIEGEYTKIIWDKNLPETDKWDYCIACASGVASAALDIIFGKIPAKEVAQNLAIKKSDDVVKTVSKCAGFNAKNTKEAIMFFKKQISSKQNRLQGKFIETSTGDPIEFSKQSTLPGLAFSLITQFTGNNYGLNKDGELSFEKTNDDYKIGSTMYEKVYFGVVHWIANVLETNNLTSLFSTNKDTNKEINLISGLSQLSSNKAIKKVFELFNAEKKDVKKFFIDFLTGDATLFKNKKINLDLENEIGLKGKIHTISILINECIIRAFYSIRRFVLEIKNNEVNCIDDLYNLQWKRILPFNNRTIIRMQTVSTGVFFAATTAKAAIVSSRSSETWVTQLGDFIININYPGAFQFVASIIADRKFLVDDAKFLCQLIKDNYKLVEPKKLVNIDNMLLNKNQIRILYSLKRDEVIYDILKTSNLKIKKAKEEWLKKWEEKTLAIINKDSDYFLEREDIIESICYEKEFENDGVWLELILMESLFFVPYYPFDGIDAKKSIKQSSFYEKDILCDTLHLISIEKLEHIKTEYKTNLMLIDEKNKKKLIAVGVASAILTPGLILPEIAALALGVYEVASVIEKTLAGGNVFSFLGAGVSSFNAKGIILNECAKLVTYCNCFLKENNRFDDIAIIQQALERKREEANSAIEKLEAQKTRENTALLNNYRSSLGFINMSNNILKSNKLIEAK